MNERIYYTDPQLATFDAVVSGMCRIEDRPAVILDTTAFYPTSGGQPHDTGLLGDVRVGDVVEDEAGRICHVVDREIEVGTRVSGRIDWQRRFDHMQQHTGQHILSAALDRVASARTVGFHLGADVSSVDLATPVSPDLIAAAEAEANRVVWEDRPVTIRFVSGTEAASLPLRKEPTRTGVLRVIEVDGYDLSACGGTHVSRTGAVGLVAVMSSERLRGGTRIEFVCGGRALATLRKLRDAVAGCIHHVSVAPEELPAAVERLQAESKDQRKAARSLREQLAKYEAAAMADRAETAGGVRRVIAGVEGHDQGGLKAMATAICERSGYEVALFSTDSPHLAVVARSSDARAHCGAALRALHQRFGGKGGGKPDLAQGGGLTGSLAEIIEAARHALEDS